MWEKLQVHISHLHVRNLNLQLPKEWAAAFKENEFPVTGGIQA